MELVGHITGFGTGIVFDILQQLALLAVQFHQRFRRIGQHPERMVYVEFGIPPLEAAEDFAPLGGIEFHNTDLALYVHLHFPGGEAKDIDQSDDGMAINPKESVIGKRVLNSVETAVLFIFLAIPQIDAGLRVLV